MGSMRECSSCGILSRYRGDCPASAIGQLDFIRDFFLELALVDVVIAALDDEGRPQHEQVTLQIWKTVVQFCPSGK